MYMATRIAVSPAVIAWLRRSAGASLEQAAKLANTSPVQFERWENGETAPTINQLRTLSKAFRQPFGIFLRAEAPARELETPRDFRTHQGAVAERNDPRLLLQLRMAERRRQQALDLLEELQEEPPQLELALELRDDPERAGQAVRQALGITRESQRAWRTGEVALSRLRDLVEKAGVLVGQFTRLDLSEARGASVATFPMPLILVNPRDPASARVFTLLHETTHLGLHVSGICDIDDDLERPPEEQRLEIFCNAVAAAALVPERELFENPVVRAHGRQAVWSDDELDQIRRDFGVSKYVILRRLLTFERTTNEFYRAAHERWNEEFRNREQQPGFVPHYRKAISASGKQFARLVLRAYHEDIITLSEASDYLRTKAKNLPAIEGEVL